MLLNFFIYCFRRNCTKFGKPGILSDRIDCFFNIPAGK